jgi:hypothetical protein
VLLNSRVLFASECLPGFFTSTAFKLLVSLENYRGTLSRTSLVRLVHIGSARGASVDLALLIVTTWFC